MRITLRWVQFFGLSILLMVAGFHLVDLAKADNGPHGGYSTLTDACSGCHRAHTALSSRLLIDSVPNLCISCHGTTGSGADTNVLDGIYLERDGNSEIPFEGIHNRGLKAGGFLNALMDTDWDLVSASSPATSGHIYDGTTGTVWGNGPLGSGPGALNFPLSCVTCHDPHGGAGSSGEITYRLLRAIPSGSGAPVGITIPDETDKFYAVSNGDNQYFGENYGSRGPLISAWCSQCHTRYLAPTGSGQTDSGDPNFKFRHMTTSTNLGCMNCHVAHGSAADMGAFSGVVSWPDGTTSPNGNGRSSLLRVDNRGVCQLCHLK